MGNVILCRFKLFNFSNQAKLKFQKIIISKYSTFSKVNALLTAIRNSIAHGHFSIIDDYFIGFNKKRTTTEPEDLKKAVIKISDVQSNIYNQVLFSYSLATKKTLNRNEYECKITVISGKI